MLVLDQLLLYYLSLPLLTKIDPATTEVNMTDQS